ncbi:hypothetical protein [Streptomyces sp. N35]|uniref:hypothetical protein n=1 Tax=Streptomyces sp. N35 TaxID=2795730 RepID=UPI0018F664F9|nr:hypothetical protein [Streptomyces sp. N35]
MAETWLPGMVITAERLNGTAWAPLTLSSGFTHPGHGFTPAYRLLGSAVILRGRISKTSGTIADTDVIATVPAALRPAAAVGWAGPRNGSSPGMVRLELNTAGEVKVFAGTASPSWISLDLVTYFLD